MKLDGPKSNQNEKKKEALDNQMRQSMMERVEQAKQKIKIFKDEADSGEPHALPEAGRTKRKKERQAQLVQQEKEQREREQREKEALDELNAEEPKKFKEYRPREMPNPYLEAERLQKQYL